MRHPRDLANQEMFEYSVFAYPPQSEAMHM